MAGIYPTDAAIKAIKSSIEDYMAEGKALADYLAEALEGFKCDLYNLRTMRLDEIFTGSLAAGVYADPLGDGMNELQCKRMLALRTISNIFYDYAEHAGDNKDSQYWGLGHEHREQYDNLMTIAKLSKIVQTNNQTTVPNSGFMCQ